MIGRQVIAVTAVLLATATPTILRACDLALFLAVDVSGSVDQAEYEIQRDGLAAALRDPFVAEALVRAEAFVAVMQWTGENRQRVTVPWTQVDGFPSLEGLANTVEQDPRVWRNYSTAIGEALFKAADMFDTGPDCQRRVIDVSGDGRSNEGISPIGVHPALRQRQITVNALVIEGEDDDLTGYFWENVIYGPGAFVETANGFEEYPEKIRKKLLREITQPVSRTIGPLCDHALRSCDHEMRNSIKLR